MSAIDKNRNPGSARHNCHGSQTFDRPWADAHPGPCEKYQKIPLLGWHYPCFSGGMRSPQLSLIFAATLAISGLSSSASASPIVFNQGSYLSQDDSPFNESNFSFFYLEDFEDASLNTPGVSASGGHTIGLDPYVDSVEGGSNGHSW